MPVLTRTTLGPALAVLLTVACPPPDTATAQVSTAGTTSRQLIPGLPVLDLQSLLDKARESQAPTLTLPTGTFQVPTDRVLLQGFTNFVLEGKGTTLVFPNPASWALAVTACQNLTLRGFTIDYAQLPFTQATITDKAPDGTWLQFELHQGYPTLGPGLLGSQVHAFDAKTRGWKVGQQDLYGKTEVLTATTGRVSFSRPPDNIEQLVPGDFLVFNRRGAGAVDLRDSTTVRMEDVTILTSPGLGISGRHLSGANYFRCTVKRGPRPAGATQDRLLSTGADAFNYADSRSGPTLEKCDFSFMGDDSVNLHGLSWPVLKVEGNAIWTARFVGPRPYKDDMLPGDVARIMSPGNFAVRSTGVLAKWEDNVPADGLEITPELWKKIWPQRPLGNRTTFYKINLEAPVAVSVGDTIDFPAANTPGYVIRDNYFHDHRARGLRLQGTDGLIEGNRFERIKGAAIAIGPELVYWREAGWPERVVIRGNTIRDVGQGADILKASSFTPGAISLYCRLEEPATQKFGQEIRDVQILDNTIEGCSVAGIHINASRGVRVENNRISNVNTLAGSKTGSDFGLHSRYPVTVQNSAGVTVDGRAVQEEPALAAAPVNGTLSLTRTALAQQLPPLANEVVATLQDTQPAEAALVSHLGPNPGGWQWRWTQDTGRRDVGQTFTAPQDFTLDKISLAIRSGSTAANSRAPFTLKIHRFADPRAIAPVEQLAAWKGLLPANENGTAYLEGRWLTLKGPQLRLLAGNVYGFTLQFDAPKATGQGVVFGVPQTESYAGGRGLFSTDGQTWQHNYDFNFLVHAVEPTTGTNNPGGTPAAGAMPARAPRTLEVDQRGGAEFKTLAAAARAARPGDTIAIRPGSGPYREVLRIPASGTAESPIIVEGNGNLVTGFEPLTGWTTVDGVTSCRLPAFPCVLTYRGERLVQDTATRQFSLYATLNEARDTLTLLPGVLAEGWEISRRPFAVQITDVSYQTFKNLRASGSTNDGFNLHGKGQGLLFDNVEGFHNQDEGFSSHDEIVSEVRNSTFWGNDNGIANVGNSNTTLTRVDTRDNLGFGFWLNDCKATVRGLRSWSNGAEQVRLRNATVQLEDVVAFTPPTAVRATLSYQESATVPTARAYSEARSTFTGAVTVQPQPAPAASLAK